jgi:hypothetical protein
MKPQMNADKRRLKLNLPQSAFICVHPRFIFLLFFLTFTPIAHGQTSTSALIGRALDSQVAELSAKGGLLDVMKAIEDQTGIRLEAEPAVWDALPWGQDTTIGLHIKNTTAREALDVLTRKLGLTYRLGDEAVVLEPSPALARLGRRATLDEIHALDLLAITPLDLTTESPTIEQMLDAVDAKLASSGLAVQDRAFDTQGLSQTIQIAHNATLSDALDELDHQTDATWYPWGRSIVVTRKIDAVRLLLGKRLTRHFRDAPLEQVLTDLAEFSGVEFTYAPGVLQNVPPKFRRVTLTLNGATVEQTLQILSGATGLSFAPTDHGIDVGFSPPATQPGR